jgi:hypothetical protein
MRTAAEIIVVIATSSLLASCASTVENRGRPREAAEPGRSGQASQECRRLDPPERVEVGFRQTVRTASKIAITFANQTHDSHDNGTSDVLLHLVFQGVDEGGNLTPSALTWTPSALARPEWTYVAIDRCVRIVEVGSQRVVLDVSKPSR